MRVPKMTTTGAFHCTSTKPKNTASSSYFPHSPRMRYYLSRRPTTVIKDHEVFLDFIVANNIAFLDALVSLISFSLFSPHINAFQKATIGTCCIGRFHIRRDVFCMRSSNSSNGIHIYIVDSVERSMREIP